MKIIEGLRQNDLKYLVSNYIDVDYSKLTDRMLKEFWILNNSEKAKERIRETFKYNR